MIVPADISSPIFPISHHFLPPAIPQLLLFPLSPSGDVTLFVELPLTHQVWLEPPCGFLATHVAH